MRRPIKAERLAEYDKEDKLYSWRYQNGYTASAAGRLVGYIGKRYLGCKRILDAGCGEQSFAAHMQYWKYDGAIIGVDVSEFVARERIRCCPVIHAPLEAIPAPANWFDGLFCSDVLEHVSEKNGKLVNSLVEMRRVLAPKCLWGFTICCESSLQKGPNKEELHVTVKEPDWWREKLKSVGFEHVFGKKTVQRDAAKADSLTVYIWGH